MPVGLCSDDMGTVGLDRAGIFESQRRILMRDEQATDLQCWDCREFDANATWEDCHCCGSKCVGIDRQRRCIIGRSNFQGDIAIFALIPCENIE